jgi:hypothetical protein
MHLFGIKRSKLSKRQTINKDMLRITSASIRKSLASKIAPFSSTPIAKNIGFSLNQDQLDLQDLARKFTAEQIIPKAAHHDVTGEYPTEILKKAWEAGLLNGHVPEKFGGLGLSVLDCAVLSEELAYGCTGIQTAAEANGLAEAPVILVRLIPSSMFNLTIYLFYRLEMIFKRKNISEE